MILKFKTPAKLKKHYKQEFGEAHFTAEYEQFKRDWELTHPPLSKPTPEIKEFRECSIQTDPLPDDAGACCKCEGVPNVVSGGQGDMEMQLLWQQMQFWQNLNQIYWVQSRQAPTYGLQ